MTRAAGKEQNGAITEEIDGRSKGPDTPDLPLSLKSPISPLLSAFLSAFLSDELDFPPFGHRARVERRVISLEHSLAGPGSRDKNRVREFLRNTRMVPVKMRKNDILDITRGETGLLHLRIECERRPPSTLHEPTDGRCDRFFAVFGDFVRKAEIERHEASAWMLDQECRSRTPWRIGAHQERRHAIRTRVEDPKTKSLHGRCERQPSLLDRRAGHENGPIGNQNDQQHDYRNENRAKSNADLSSLSFHGFSRSLRT